MLKVIIYLVNSNIIITFTQTNKKEIKIMTKKEHEAFLKAVDLVCINCVCMDEETCTGCPVRKSVDYYNN